MFKHFCKTVLTIFRWKVEGQLPNKAKFIIIVAPHTSNWDFVIGVLVRGVLGQKINFLGKHQLFINPWGIFFRAIGGSPVDRRQHNNLVDAAVQHFKTKDEYKLALTPEGTRAEVKRWRTGFYHIAKQAQVPIVPVGFDFKKHTVFIGEPTVTSNDMVADINQLMDFFRTMEGKHPKKIPIFK